MMATAYDETDGDFNFTRGSKRTKVETEPAIVEETVLPVRKGRTPAKPKADGNEEAKGQKKKTVRREMNFATPKQDADSKATRRSTRRSTRLSGEGQDLNMETSKRGTAVVDDSVDMVGQIANTTSTSTPASKESTKIALPFSDTPVINRNKELRRKGSVSRRSSLGMRGRRASSLIDNGHSAMPHREVQAEEFYKHIAADGISEPRRMKQLLTWCGERKLPEKPAHDAPDSHARQIGKHVQIRCHVTKTNECLARAIQDEILKDFSSRSDFSDWFSREDVVRPTVIKKPNPRNTENADEIGKLEERIKKYASTMEFLRRAQKLTETRLQMERKQWAALTAAPPPLPPLLPDKTFPTPESIDVSMLSFEEAAILSRLTTSSSASSQHSSAQSHIQNLQSGLEFKVDQFAHGIHALTQYRETAECVADRVLALGAQALEDRSRKEREEAGTRDLPVMEVLRSLSRILPEGRS
jgi:kinetochore protein Mis13/DSN1